jgi:hypothetical protein
MATLIIFGTQRKLALLSRPKPQIVAVQSHYAPRIHAQRQANDAKTIIAVPTLPHVPILHVVHGIPQQRAAVGRSQLVIS